MLGDGYVLETTEKLFRGHDMIAFIPFNDYDGPPPLPPLSICQTMK
jgi:hypothetical protein